MKQLIECVPNFSEGNNLEIINQITDAIASVEGIKVLNVDPGKATNRTVVTFVGEPQAATEAAFRGISKAAELIDTIGLAGTAYLLWLSYEILGKPLARYTSCMRTGQL